jgi:hypothetical protein
VRLADGALLSLAQLFQPGASEKIAKRLQPELRRALGDGVLWDGWIEEHSALVSDFSLEPGGVRFSLYNLAPHVLKGPLGEGFLVPCSELGAFGLAPFARESLCGSR